jgi:hypothetical protein
MADINLTQAEADALIALAKQRVDMREWDYPDLGRAISIPMVSADRREQFLLDLRRGRIDLAKGAPTRTAPDRSSFWSGSTSVGHRTRIQMARRLARLISICTARDTVTSGPFRHRAIDL